MKIVWTGPFRQDLRDILEFIAENNPKAARSLLAEIKERVCVLVDEPQLGRVGRVEGTREQALTGTHYTYFPIALKINKYRFWLFFIRHENGLKVFNLVGNDNKSMINF